MHIVANKFGKNCAKNHNVSLFTKDSIHTLKHFRNWNKHSLLPTIETCFNCFEIRSLDAKRIKRRHKNPRNFKFKKASRHSTLQDGASVWRRDLFTNISAGTRTTTRSWSGWWRGSTGTWWWRPRTSRPTASPSYRRRTPASRRPRGGHSGITPTVENKS